jgi:dTDP-4-amino-4,6-dideoxygalactose transaminase
MSSTKSLWPVYSDEEIQAAVNTLKSGKVNYWTGQEGRLFEKEFSNFCNTSYAIAVSNGTVAIDLALKSLDIGAGDEVIVTPRSFIASVSCIINAGATPIFADVDKDTGNIYANSIRGLINTKTKAILCVHLAGISCEMDEMLDLANQNNISIIEDCSQAHGAKYKGRPVGSIGHIGCWSFCQDKIISTGGEGGMVTTNSELLWRKMWAYKDHGKSYEAVYERDHPEGFRWLHESFGTNWRMTEIQAAIGRIQLKKINKWQKIREDNVQKIWNVAASLKGIRHPKIPSYIKNAGYKCYLYIEPEHLKKNWTRNRIINEINSSGVQCFEGSCSEIYLEKAFKNYEFKPKTRLKNAKELGSTSLMFLVSPNLTKIEIHNTCKVIEDVISKSTY